MKNRTLGTTIAALRKEKGMTQLELAEKMGVTDKAVSKWERDLSCPDVNSIPKLVELLGVTVDELMHCKTPSKQDSEEKTEHIGFLICKGVALAMGVAAVVLSVLKQLDVNSGFGLLGVGLVSLSVLEFMKK